MWVEILNKSYEKELTTDRGSPLGFVVIGPEHLKFKHETQTTTKKKKERKKKKKKKRPPYHRKDSGSSQKQKRQLRGSLNRYGFA